MKKSLLFFLLILNSGFIILHSHSSVYAQTQTHPFLIVKSDDYPALRARATRSPWEEMKTSADNDCMTMVYDPNNYSGNTASPVNQQARYKPWQMRNIVSACALAYILEDPSQQNNNATAYLQKFRDALLQTHKVGTSTISNIDDLRNFQENGGDGWAQQVGVGSALFDMILAYDIFYDGLNTMYPSDRVTIESKFQPFMDYFIQHNENFINKYGILVTWDIFKNNSSLNNDKYKYLSYLFGHDASPSPQDYASGLMNSEGIFKEGMGYAGFRLAHIRDSKSHVIDVLQFTGKDTTLYSDQRLKNFYEWWYGYATTPFGMMATFGDTAAYQGMNSYDWGSTMDTSSHIGAALRYSNLAGEAAMWKNGGKPFPGRLLNYLMMPDPLPTANIPPSKIFPQSGAFFLEHDNTSTKALYGALWNNTASEYHSHKDVNAVYIAAYGEPLLMNSGYNGAGEPGKDNESVMRFTNVVPTVTFSRNYTWDRAVSNNVAMINYTIGNPYNPNGPSQSNDHNTNYGGSTLGYPGTGRLGAGIKEGFAGKGFFDYASGETVYQASCSFCVDTLPNGKHTRNFVFVQPQDGKNGYFVLFDELLVKNGGTGDKVHIVLHPNSDAGTLKTISPATEYSGFVGPYRTINIPPSTVATGIDIFLGTQPSGVTLNDGVFAYWTPYPEDANGYQSFISKYLFSTYPVNSGGKKNVVTVLFPFDETHTKGVMERISGTGYSGAKITQGNISDTAIELSSSALTNHDSVSVQGLASLWRKNGNDTVFYFVRKGRSFNDGETNRKGFQTNSDISLFLRDTDGYIVSPGASVTFYYPQLTGIKIDGQTISSTQGANFVTATVASGTHTIELITSTGGSTPTSGPVMSPTPTFIPGDINGDEQVNGEDLILILGKYGQSGVTTGEDINTDGKVNMLDAGIVIKNWGS